MNERDWVENACVYYDFTRSSVCFAAKIKEAERICSV